MQGIKNYTITERKEITNQICGGKIDQKSFPLERIALL
jgi:hypothetical protein